MRSDEKEIELFVIYLRQLRQAREAGAFGTDVARLLYDDLYGDETEELPEKPQT